MAKDSFQSTLELLVLKALDRKPNHGFGITLHIEATSDGLLTVEEGSLYPALHRMEKAGLLAGDWQTTEHGRRARVYKLTASGKKRLAEAERSWTSMAKGMMKVLKAV